MEIHRTIHRLRAGILVLGLALLVLAGLLWVLPSDPLIAQEELTGSHPQIFLNLSDTLGPIYLTFVANPDPVPNGSTLQVTYCANGGLAPNLTSNLGDSPCPAGNTALWMVDIWGNSSPPARILVDGGHLLVLTFSPGPDNADLQISVWSTNPSLPLALLGSCVVPFIGLFWTPLRRPPRGGTRPGPTGTEDHSPSPPSSSPARQGGD